MPRESPINRLPETGADVVATAEGAALVRTSAGRFLRAQDPPETLLNMLPETPPSGSEAALYLNRLSSEIASGEEQDSHARWPRSHRRIALIGSGPVLDELSCALEELGVKIHHFASTQGLVSSIESTFDGTRFSLMLAYAGSPQEHAEWTPLDVISQSGCAWLRAYREGEVYFVDPLSISPEDASSEQVTRRRLAASQTPGSLSLWRDQAPPPSTPEPATARILVVARLLSIALAWAQGAEEVANYRRTLWKLVSPTGTVSTHTVLGYQAPHRPDRSTVRR